jgi:hypothetical protein
MLPLACRGPEDLPGVECQHTEQHLCHLLHATRRRLPLVPGGGSRHPGAAGATPIEPRAPCGGQRDNPREAMAWHRWGGVM